MFTVAARHLHRKMRYIHLFVNLSSTKRTQNEYGGNLTYPDHQNNCIGCLIIPHEEVFGQDKIQIGQFFYLGKNLLPSANA